MGRGLDRSFYRIVPELRLRSPARVGAGSVQAGSHLVRECRERMRFPLSQYKGSGTRPRM